MSDDRSPAATRPWQPGPWDVVTGAAGHFLVERASTAVLARFPHAAFLSEALLCAAGPAMYEALALYLATYADTMTHPTPAQEAAVILAARAALATATPSNQRSDTDVR